jgi:hypothetical protein
MGAALVAKDCRSLPASSVAIFGQPSSLQPEISGIAMELEDCPGEEDLSILTESLSSTRLLIINGSEPMQTTRFTVSMIYF